MKEEEGDPLAGLTRQGNFENDGVHSVQGGISTEVIERMRNEVRESWLAGPAGSREGRKIVFVDGFLLFGKSVPAPLRDLFDVKILLRARYEDAKRRREGRSGYVTLEGFWRDPEGYFDGVVWPNFVGEHEGLVEVGEGEGRFGEEVWCSDERWGLERCLEWVVGVLGREVRGGEKGVDG